MVIFDGSFLLGMAAVIQSLGTLLRVWREKSTRVAVTTPLMHSRWKQSVSRNGFRYRIRYTDLGRAHFVKGPVNTDTSSLRMRWQNEEIDMPDIKEDPTPTEPNPLKKDDAPLHDPEQDAENIEEEGELFPGNFA